MAKGRFISLRKVKGRNRQDEDEEGRTTSRRFKPSLKIFVAVPWLYGKVHPSCLEHIEAQSCPVEVMSPYYVPPPIKNRNYGKQGKPWHSAQNVNRYIEAFLKTDATHMWMLDADCEAPPHTLHELLKLDVDVASGVTFPHNLLIATTAMKWMPKMRPKSRKSKPYYKFLRPNQILGNIMRTPTKMATGAFCILIRRRVLEKQHPKVKEIRFRWKEPQEYGIDIQFWTDAQYFGFTAAIHGGIVCGHLPEHPLKKLEDLVWCRDA